MSEWDIGGDYDAWKTAEPEEWVDPYDLECELEEAALARAEAMSEEASHDV